MSDKQTLLQSVSGNTCSSSVTSRHVPSQLKIHFSPHPDSRILSELLLYLIKRPATCNPTALPPSKAACPSRALNRGVGLVSRLPSAFIKSHLLSAQYSRKYIFTLLCWCFLSYWFLPLAFCCSTSSLSSRRSWKFHLNSSGPPPPPLFPLQESAAFLFAARTAEQRRGAASEDAPAALLRSSRGAGFLPDMAEGGSLSFFFFKAGRLDDPRGGISCLCYNRVQQSENARL